MADSGQSHLSRRDLSGISGIDEITKKLAEELLLAEFVKDTTKKGQEHCIDKRFPLLAKPLFVALGLQEDYEGKITNVIRIRGPTIARFKSKSADLIAIQAWGIDPTLEGTKLPPNIMVHITKGVEVVVEDESTVDLLFVAIREERR